MSAASKAYAEGRVMAARDRVAGLLTAPQAQAPAARMAVLETLLDICIHGHDPGCVVRHAKTYLDLVVATPEPNGAVRRSRARRASYYFDYARFVVGGRAVAGEILDGPAWKNESSLDVELYLDRQALAADLMIALDRPEAALETVDRRLSLIASLKNAGASPFAVATALSHTIQTLVRLDMTERATGLLKVGGGFIASALPPQSVDAALFHQTAGELLQQTGDTEAAATALARAAAIFEAADMEPAPRAGLLGPTLTLRAAVCAVRLDSACAEDSLRRHPLAAVYAQGDRAPMGLDEVSYLAARLMASIARRTPDRVAAEALRRPARLDIDPRTQRLAEVYRAAGLALSASSEAERLAATRGLGRALKAAAETRALGVGAWYRPGALDRILLGLALTAAGQPGAPTGQADVDFALLQLVQRTAPPYDADALTALGRARSPLERRSIHEALRLRARRDRLERTEIQAILQQAGQPSPDLPRLAYDTARRRIHTEYALRIRAAERSLRDAGIGLAGANLVSLKSFQAVLAPDEAALTMGPGVGGGFTYMCVRRDGATVTAATPAGVERLGVDLRLLQASLTATHAPSAALDSQYPAEAATRAYDVLIRPFETCLKPGDRIVWLPGIAGVTGTAVPLAALLASLPPPAGQGYDLSAADWLVRRHAVSYPGAASVVVASRAAPAGAKPALDFLGVGDPVLTGQLADGQSRARAVLGGVRGGTRVEGLAPLPDTRDELEESSRRFRQRRLLTGPAATERGVRSELLGAYSYLSFATHGLMRDDLQGLAEPALVLTPVSVEDAGDNGLFTASEIADLNLGARFVALSACNTANFDLGQIGQDLPALASAFAVAGVPSTLATLWPVESLTGRQVVAGAFNAVDERGAAQALAEAQRRFLAAPPSPAYLHPRFWAPFVVLGEGGPPAPDAPGQAPALREVELVTQNGGEVLNVRRNGGGVLARLISERNDTGRLGSSLSSSRAPGGDWRVDAGDLGASRFVATLRGQVLAAGYETTPDRRTVPVLNLHDARSGAVARTWRGAALSPTSAAVLAGTQDSERAAVVAVGEVVAPPGRKVKLWLFRIDEALQPKLVAEVATPAATLLDVTLAVRGEELILTYSERFRPRANVPFPGEDDFIALPCFAEPVAWIERRALKTGALKAAREVAGLTISASTVRAGQVYLAGAAAPACGSERRAAVFGLGAGLETTRLFQDAALGASEVRSLSALPDGRLFVAARKEARLGFNPPGEGQALFAPDPAEVSAGMVLVLSPRGEPSEVRMLEGGSDVFVGGADASQADDVLLGGAVGDRAAIFHFDVPPGG